MYKGERKSKSRDAKIDNLNMYCYSLEHGASVYVLGLKEDTPVKLRPLTLTKIDIYQLLEGSASLFPKIPTCEILCLLLRTMHITKF